MGEHCSKILFYSQLLKTTSFVEDNLHMCLFKKEVSLISELWKYQLQTGRQEHGSWLSQLCLENHRRICLFMSRWNPVLQRASQICREHDFPRIMLKYRSCLHGSGKDPGNLHFSRNKAAILAQLWSKALWTQRIKGQTVFQPKIPSMEAMFVFPKIYMLKPNPQCAGIWRKGTLEGD